MPPERIEISRVEYEEKVGLKADPYSIGARIVTSEGATLVEYIFTEDQGPTVEWLEKKLFKL